MTIRDLKNEMVQVQKLCRRGVHDMGAVEPEAVQPLLKVRERILSFLQSARSASDEIEALRLMYYAECYLLNFRKAKEYLEKVCALSGDRKDRVNLIGLNEVVAKLKTLTIEPEKLHMLRDYLSTQLEEQLCDHTLRFTKLWLDENVDKKNRVKVLRGLQNNGGYCDCEVLANVCE